MAKVVFIFGAGASRSCGVPVMKDFLDRSYELLLSNKAISKEDFERVFKVIDQLQILHAKSKTDTRNIESIFNLVEMAKLVGHLPGTKREDIPRAADSIRRVLAQTIEYSCEFPVDEGYPIAPSSYLHFAATIRERRKRGVSLDWSFITFNYDVALDFALHWCSLPLNYGLEMNVHREAVKLFKLHGSLNWTTCRCGVVVPLGLDKIMNVQRPLRMGGPVYVPVTDSLTKAHHCSAGVTGVPAIVPPSWNKTQYDKHSEVWRLAASELAEAENIVVIGYSLPESDAFFHDLFRLGIAGPTRVKRFLIVNPDEETAKRFHSLLGPELEERFDSLDKRFEDAAPGLVDTEW